MKKLLSSLLWIIISVNLFAYSQNIQISLLTQDEGDELYAYFGHTAIRVKDDSLFIDKVYNYGTFDFNTPGFYSKFIKGDLNYCLSIDDFEYFVYFSNLTNRTIREQVLILEYDEKVNIVNLLETCYYSEARYYRYDFLENNCATKIRDILYDGTDGRIDFSKSKFEGKTFRQLLHPFVGKNYWSDLGINLVMGKASDREAKPEDYMFLPIYIHDFLQDSDFAIDSYVLLDASPAKKDGFNSSYLHPWIIVFVLLVLSIIRKSRKAIYYIVLSVFGLLGLFILALGIYSLHPSLGYNLNVLWTIPALILIIVRKGRLSHIIRFVYLSIIILLFANWFWLPQELTFSLIPWMLLLVISLVLNTDFKVVFKKI